MDKKRNHRDLDPMSDSIHSTSTVTPKKIKLEPSIGRISNSKLQVQDEDNFYDRFLLEHSSYDWLYIHEKAMHCRDCDALYAPESTKYRFAGSKNFQNSTLKTHHNSTSHEIAVKHNKPTQQKFISDIKTWTSCLPETPEDKHLQLLKNMYFLAKHNISLCHYETLNQHLKEAGVPLPANFYSNKSGRVILHTIGYHLCSAIAEEISKGSTLGLMFDEATNISGTKDLVVYGQYVKDWEMKCRFLTLIPLHAYQASDIFQTLHRFLEKFELLSLVTSITTDGAYVMRGEHGGVVKKFQDIVSKSIVDITALLTA